MYTSFTVAHAGPSISVQDAGRTGVLRFGVSTSGAMDRVSYRLANAAVDNAAGHPAIEVSLGGLTLICTDGAITVAIVGGHFSVSLNKQALPPWCLVTVSAGDTLSVKPGAWGSWCYVAFAGLLEADQWLNSYSVHLNSGVCGKTIQSEDTVHVHSARVLGEQVVSLLEPDVLAPKPVFRAVLGPQQRFFNVDDQQRLFDSEFTVSNQYDRMGMRLSGHNLAANASLDMPSEPISRGSLQVPGHGDPICLMADHHTAGGYPKIATVISADQDALAQKRTGDTIQFEQVTAMDAVHAVREFNSYEHMLLENMQANRQGIDARLWSNNLVSGVSNADDFDAQ